FEERRAFARICPGHPRLFTLGGSSAPQRCAHGAVAAMPLRERRIGHADRVLAVADRLLAFGKARKSASDLRAGFVLEAASFVGVGGDRGERQRKQSGERKD